MDNKIKNFGLFCMLVALANCGNVPVEAPKAPQAAPQAKAQSKADETKTADLEQDQKLKKEDLGRDQGLEGKEGFNIPGAHDGDFEVELPEFTPSKPPVFVDDDAEGEEESVEEGEENSEDSSEEKSLSLVGRWELLSVRNGETIVDYSANPDFKQVFLIKSSTELAIESVTCDDNKPLTLNLAVEIDNQKIRIRETAKAECSVGGSVVSEARNAGTEFIYSVEHEFLTLLEKVGDSSFEYTFGRSLN